MSTFDTTDPANPTIDKDPDATLDYSWDWSTWLDGDTISSRSFVVDTGLTVVSSQEVAGVVTAFISGGTAGQLLRATCRIVTALGRTDDRSIVLKIVER